MQEEQNLLAETNLIIDNKTAGYLKDAAGWGIFVAVIGFILSCIAALVGIFAGVEVSRITSNYSGTRLRIAEGLGVTFIYVGGATLLFLMSFYLFHFSKKIKVAITKESQQDIPGAFKNLKHFFRLTGVTSIISIVLMVLGVIGFILAQSYGRY